MVTTDRLGPGIEAHEQWPGGAPQCLTDTIERETPPAFTIQKTAGWLAMQGVDAIYSRAADGDSATGTFSVPLGEVTTDLDDTDTIPDELMPATIRDFEYEFTARYRELTERRRPQNAVDEGWGDLDSLRFYGDVIGCYPQLSKDQSTELAKMIEAGVLARSLLGGDTLHGDFSDAGQLAYVAAIGDRAHQVLYHSNLKLVMSLARRHARDDSFPILDAIQEGDIQLNRAIYRYDYKRDEAAFSSFAYEVIDYGLRDAYAEAVRQQRATLIGECGALAIVAEGASDRWRETPSPTSARTLRLADEALNALTPAQQMVFLLRYGLRDTRGSHSVDDIASLLGYTKGSVKDMLAQGRRRLREHFKGRDYSGSALAALATPEIGEPLEEIYQSTKDSATSDRALWPSATSDVTESQRGLLTEALTILSPSHSKIVSLFYGLGDVSGRHTLRDIAIQMDYASPASIATVLYKCRLRMKAHLENRDRPKPVVTYGALQSAEAREFDALMRMVFDHTRDDSLSDEDYLHTESLRTTIERAILLLGTDREAVVSRYYGTVDAAPMSQPEVAEATGIRYVKSVLQRARQELRSLIPAIAEGSLDLVEWHKHNSSRRNVLVYLARAGMDIPADYDLPLLRILARRHIAELPISESQREILIKLYGLGKGGISRNTVELAAEYGVSSCAISELEDRVIRKSKRQSL